MRNMFLDLYSILFRIHSNRKRVITNKPIILINSKLFCPKHDAYHLKCGLHNIVPVQAWDKARLLIYMIEA